MQLMRKNSVKTNVMYSQRFVCLPDYVILNFDKFSNSTLKVILNICRYLSSETGRKKQYKAFSLSEMIANFDLSRSSIKKAIKEIEENNVFLVHEDKSLKEKSYVFFAYNEENIKLFEELENGKSELKMIRFFECVKNKIKCILCRLIIN